MEEATANSPCHKSIGSLEVQIRAFLTSTLNGADWSASFPSRFTPEEITQRTR
jgi:hypothetical protein